MRRKPYPRLSHENATKAAEIYLEMVASERFIWRTVEFGFSTTNYGYKQVLQALHRLEDNGIVGNRSVGDAGNIWWLKTREIPKRHARE